MTLPDRVELSMDAHIGAIFLYVVATEMFLIRLRCRGACVGGAWGQLLALEKDMTLVAFFVGVLLAGGGHGDSLTPAAFASSTIIHLKVPSLGFIANAL